METSFDFGFKRINWIHMIDIDVFFQLIRRFHKISLQLNGCMSSRKKEQMFKENAQINIKNSS